MFISNARANANWAAVSLLLLFASYKIIQTVHSVSSGRLDKLSRDELLRLDDEVSQFYTNSYAELDNKSISFEQQLYAAIRAVRHTTIMEHFDFRYTSNETKWKSMGERVDRAACKLHLTALVAAVNSSLQRRDEQDGMGLPLSVIDFLGASGQMGAGVLNGNFAWLGSSTSCEHAHIPANTVRRFLPTGGQNVDDIRGRFCVAHLRATSWPKWDIYFEDRITIKRGLCLPISCHTALHDEEPDIQQQVAILARAYLMAPFSDAAKFEVSHLYCLPDEDSEFRQLDLGARLFIVFIIFWPALTLWVNIKYTQRRNAIKRLRDTIDIRMIIDDTSLEQEQPNGHAEDGPRDMKLLAGDLPGGNGSASNCSSVATTPVPSDLEDNDSDLALIDPFKAKRSTRKRRGSRTGRSATQPRDEEPQSTEMDFVRALSIEANLSFMFYQPRPNLVQTKNDAASRGKKHSSAKSKSAGSAPSRSPTVARRSSSSNEAFVKQLHDEEERESNVAIMSSAADETDDKSTLAGHEQRASTSTRSRRVSIEVLDGLKVIATCYIVYGHTMMFFFGCVTDLRFGVERMFDFTMIATLNTLQIVGLFYVITGCLLTYLSFSKAKLRRLLSPLFWLLVLVGRYLRLIPAYALVFWFARHVAPHTGSGRDWYDYRTDEEHARGHCGNESWWVMWTMSAADIKIPNDCVPQAWYLSDDFRTLMVLPVYIFLLARDVRVGYVAIFATFAASTWKMAHILKAANIDYKIVLRWHPHVYSLMTDRLHDVYTDFLVRMSTYLLGVIVGHLLYLYEIRYIRQWPRWFARYGMKLALLVAGCVYFGAQILASPSVSSLMPAREQLNSDTVVWLIPMFKSTMELAICVILLLLVTGGGNPLLRRLLASQPMKILSNISYAVFLTHIELMYKLPATQYESNYWYLFIYAAFCISISHLIAFFLYLLWEMPINNLTRNLFKRAFRAIS